MLWVVEALVVVVWAWGSVVPGVVGEVGVVIGRAIAGVVIEGIPEAVGGVVGEAWQVVEEVLAEELVGIMVLEQLV